MKGLRGLVSVLVVLMGLAMAVPAGAAEVVRHSGVIVSISGDAPTFVLAEVGPWRIRDGATVVTYRTITLVPETAFAFLGRFQETPSGFPGDFVEVPVGPEEVFLNDFVTVECRHEGKQLVALKITVTALPDSP